MKTGIRDLMMGLFLFEFSIIYLTSSLISSSVSINPPSINTYFNLTNIMANLYSGMGGTWAINFFGLNISFASVETGIVYILSFFVLLVNFFVYIGNFIGYIYNLISIPYSILPSYLQAIIGIPILVMMVISFVTGIQILSSRFGSD